MRYASRTARWLPDALALTALGGFVALLFRQTLFGRGVLAGFDLVNYFYPLKTYAARRLAAGDVPLWNPDLFFGSPFLANIQNGVLYPPNALFSWSSFPTALLTNTVGHFCWGALGMYLLVRLGWGGSRSAALIAGSIFAGSGYLGAHAGHLNQVQAAVWLPWLLLALERAASGSAVWLVLGGWLLALQLLAGHTQEVYYSLLVAGIWTVVLAVLRRPGSVSWSGGLPRTAGVLVPVIALTAAGLNAAGLAAAQLLPTLELSGLSHREGGLTLDEATAFSVDRTHILESLLPTFWGLPSQEVIGYVGVTALVVALAGLTGSARLGRAVALAGIAALAVALSLGRYTSLYLLLHGWLPAFDSFRVLGRWLFVATFALAGLAGLGADAVLGPRSRQTGTHQAALFSLALLAVVGGLALYAWRSLAVVAIPWLPHGRVVVIWSLVALLVVGLVLNALITRPRWWHRLLMVGLVAGELLFAARPMEYQDGWPAAIYEWTPAVAQQLASLGAGDPAAPRLLSLADEDRMKAPHSEALTRAGVPPEAARYTRFRAVLRPNLHLSFGLSGADGYDGGLLPLRSYAPLQQAIVGSTAEVVSHHTLATMAPDRADADTLNRLGIGYVVADRDSPPLDGWERVQGLDTVALYRHPSPIPRIGIRISRESEQPAHLLRFAAEEIEVDVSGQGVATLVLRQTPYPGWRASIDDGPAALVVGDDQLSLTVALPAAAERVRIWYDPWAWRVGVMVSLATILLNVALPWIWVVIRRHRQTPYKARTAP